MENGCGYVIFCLKGWFNVMGGLLGQGVLGLVFCDIQLFYLVIKCGVIDVQFVCGFGDIVFGLGQGMVYGGFFGFFKICCVVVVVKQV